MNIGKNLLGPEPTYLPEDHSDMQARKAEDEGVGLEDLARRYPDASYVWAVLAEAALADGDDVAAYAFARTGYHRGLDALRKAGWRGQGPIPASHAPNRGFLRALAMLGETSRRLGDEAEVDRVQAFLREADPSLLD